MPYFQVLVIFLAPPLLVLAVITPRDVWGRLFRGGTALDWRPYLYILIHILLALAYTTPWDNYLVATGVWWYDPVLVTGVRLGWVPVEEYTFFILQTLMTGLWIVFLARHYAPAATSVAAKPRLRLWTSVLVSVLWALAVLMLMYGWQPGTYLGLIVAWALAPVLIQVAFGADILLANWRLIVWTLLPTTIYLWVVDALAIRSGTWTIDPGQTTGLFVGVLPIEEMVFFYMTNLIIGLGMVLMLSPESLVRVRRWKRSIDSRINSPGYRVWGWLKGFLDRLSGLSRYSFAWIWSGVLVFWLGVLIATPLAIWTSGEQVFPAKVTLGVLAQFMVSLLALASAWPLARLGRALLIVVTGTWIVELIGVMAGLPFGRYAYSGTLQPQAGGVPMIIPLAWFMMLAPSWAVAEVILAKARGRLGKVYPLALAALSGLVFTAWDLYLDPQMTARGLWLWEHSGGYFGIPWVNYLGWWITASVLTLFVQPSGLPGAPLTLVYVLTWIFQAVGLGIFWGQPGPALAGFAGMGLFVAWARYQEGKQWKLFSGLWPVLFPAPSRSR